MPAHVYAWTTGGVQALPEASMALQQTAGRASGQADDDFRSAQQGYQESVTQPAFVAAATPHRATSDTGLSAFLSGADVHNETQAASICSCCTPAWPILLHQAAQSSPVCVRIVKIKMNTYT